LPGNAGETETLEILIDSFGYVGYGHAMTDRKGLVGEVLLGGEPLRDWEVFNLPLDNAWLADLKSLRNTPTRPGVFFRAALQLARPGDCYLDMAGWNKGYLWVNGRLLGRYWHIGPQQHLFCPGVWLREGDNDMLVLDLHRTEPAPIGSAATLARER
jgi:beta-galactosidase